MTAMRAPHFRLGPKPPILSVMVHRLFRSLVISSVMALDAVGCTITHDRMPPPPPPPPDPDADVPLDAGRIARDAGSDAGFDAGSDAGTDAGLEDAGGPDAGDLRECEPGWPTTKAFFCTELEGGEIVCCDSILGDGGMNCCVQVSE